MSSGRPPIPEDRRRRLIPSLIPRTSFCRGDFNAEIVRDRRAPAVCFALVRRNGFPEILFLGQFRSGAEAELAARQFIADVRRPPRRRAAGSAA